MCYRPLVPPGNDLWVVPMMWIRLVVRFLVDQWFYCSCFDCNGCHDLVRRAEVVVEVVLLLPDLSVSYVVAVMQEMVSLIVVAVEVALAVVVVAVMNENYVVDDANVVDIVVDDDVVVNPVHWVSIEALQLYWL
jgi:hypothetical protein